MQHVHPPLPPLQPGTADYRVQHHVNFHLPRIMAWALQGPTPNMPRWARVRRDLMQGILPSAAPLAPELPAEVASQTLRAVDTIDDVHVDDLDEPWLMPRDAVEAVCWAALLGSLSRTAVRELAVAAHAGRAHSIPDGDAGTIAYYRALALGPNAVLAKPVIQMIQTAAHPAARLWGARQLARIAGPTGPTSQGRPRRR